MRPGSTTQGSGSARSSGTANAYIYRVSTTSATSAPFWDQIAIETKLVRRREREPYKATTDSIHNSKLSSGSSGGSGKAVNPCIFLSATLPEFVGQGGGGSGRVWTHRGRPWAPRAGGAPSTRSAVSAASRPGTSKLCDAGRNADAAARSHNTFPTTFLYRG